MILFSKPTDYRLAPAGPQEAESIQDAYGKVINRLSTVEKTLRKQAQLGAAQHELTPANFEKQAEFVDTNTKRCNRVHDHLAHTASDIEKKINEHHMTKHNNKKTKNHNTKT